jgi:hypothetical protein
MKHRHTLLLIIILFLVFASTAFARPHTVTVASQSISVLGTDGALTCEDLATLALPDTTITVAELVTTGSFDPPPGSFPPGPVTDLPVFCRVHLVVDPQINIEVWLPADTWNGRFQAVGGGGYAGSISFSAMGGALRDGYATTSTDTGHDSTVTPGGSFALNPDNTLNWQLIEDFASRSLHEMTVKAKALIWAYYGAAPVYSYWNGCSTGGRQGLMEAQRFPDDYDGILSAAPAINWDRFIPAELWPQIVMQQEVGGAIPTCKFGTLNAAVVEACDALDGVEDGLLTDPRQCDFDPAVLECPVDAPPDCDCLTSDEVEAVRKIWEGPRTTDDDFLWYGLAPGAPLNFLAGSFPSPSGPIPFPFPIATDHLGLWVNQDPAWDWQTLDYEGFEEDFQESIDLFNDVIGTDNPDLSAFRDSGGKVIMWHGWLDQLIFPQGSIDYYERVVAQSDLLHTIKFARLFMAPGVFHCAGGPGPDTFDSFGALVEWVEHGKAPNRIVASRIDDGEATMTRPLCPYPRQAVYKGWGSTDVAESFVCSMAPGHNR